jgi:hypothetical protein
MMNYEDIFDEPCSGSEPSIKLVPREDIETMYSFGHYDGPASGLAKWENEFWYIRRFGHDDYRYWLIKLTKEEQEYAAWYGAEWKRLFSSAMSWNPDGTKAPEELGVFSISKHEGRMITYDSSEYQNFSTAYKKPEPHIHAEVCGYFTSWKK